MKNTLAISLLVFAACGDNLTPPPGTPQAYDAGDLDVPQGYSGKIDGTPYQPPVPTKLDCMPNLDGKIAPNELQAAIGIPISYLVSPSGTERKVDVSGKDKDSGERLWDWSVSHADDQVGTFEASELAGKWYEASFLDGEFVTAMDAGGRVEAIYKKDDDALWLLGLASAKEDPSEGQSLLVYETPIALFRFPIQMGEEWVSAGEVKGGKLYGLPYAGKDTYEIKVDAVGELALPDLTFMQAFRVRQKVTVSPAVGKSTSRRQVSFLFECFGEVARATSLPDEPNEDFTKASEVRRLGL